MNNFHNVLKANVFVYALLFLFLNPMTAVADPQCNFRIGDYVWDDANGNGIQDSGEYGVSGVPVKLYKNGSQVNSTSTNSSGYYYFDCNSYGDYQVMFGLPVGYAFSPQNQGGDDTRDSDVNPSTWKTETFSIYSDGDYLTWDAGMNQGGGDSCPDNLLSNPGFESDFTDWELWGSEQIVSDAYVGAKAAAAVDDGFVQYVSATPAAEYTLKVWAKGSGVVGLVFYDSNDNWLDDESVNVNGTSYSMYTVNATAPANSAYVGAWVNSGDSGALISDEFCLTKEDGDVPPPTPPTCNTNTSLLWENNVVINGCDVTTDVRFVTGNTTTYTIPGPYPAAFNGSIDVFISEAVAWDGYCNRALTGDQPNERFRVVFKKNGSVVWSSPYTGLTGGADGIDTGVISDEWIGILGNPVNLPNGADEIVLEHWSVGNSWDTNANSVVPSSVCIGYETVTPQHPNCDYLYAVADDGDKLVYLPRDGSAGATLIGPLGVSSVEAITISLDESTLYAANSGTFGTINWNTGSFSSIGDFGTGGGSAGNITFNDVDGLAFDPSTGDLYGTLRRNDGSPEDVLFKINPSTGIHVPNAFGSGIDYVRIRTNAAVGLYDVDDIAIDPSDGQMYAVVNTTGGDDRIVRVDKATGIVTDVGRLHTSSSNLNDMEGLSFHNDGNFYGTTGDNGSSSTNNTTWIINTSTALCTEVHSMDIYGDYEAIAGCIDYTPITSIGDFVWYDGDENGMQNTDGSSVGVANVTVQLFHSGGASAGSTTTNSSGYYSFTNLAPGDYYLKFSNIPGGYVFTDKDQGSDDTIDSDVDPSTGQTDVTTLSAGEYDMTWDAGIHEGGDVPPPTPPTCNTNTSLLWENNVAINGCDVTTDVRFVTGNTTTYTIPGPYPSAFNGSVDVTISEAVSWDGYCNRPSTGDQPNERFRVVFKKNGSVVWSSPYTGVSSSDDGIATGVIADDWVGPLGSTVNLPNGADEIVLEHWSVGNSWDTNANSVVPSSVCIGYETVTPQLGSIGNWVWHDTYHYPASGPPNNDHDVDGIQDAGELGIEGVLVELKQGGSVIATETTDASGFYNFTDLPAGDYVVKVASSNFAAGGVLEGWYASPQNRGSNDALDSDGDGSETQPFKQAVNLSAGEHDPTIDFGFFYTCVDLTKTGPEKVKAGETITYHFRYENCGDIVHHTGARVYDPLINPDGDHEIWNGVVWPGQVVEFDRTYITTTDDCEKLKNCAWAIGHTVDPTGYSPDLANDRDDDCWEVIVLCCEIEIGDYVWWDENHNGLQDDDALFPGNAPHGLNGVRVILYDGSGNYLEETLTSNGPTGGPGWYEFVDLLPGDYTVTIDDDMFLVSYPDLIYPTYDYDGIATPHTTDVTLTDCEKNYNLDFGYDDEPLPVTLSSFTAISKNGQVELNWVTESEIENQGFLLERRIFESGDDWQESASYLTNADLRGQGTVTYSTNYVYVDRLVQVGSTYEYRLGDVDYDGIMEYHSTRMVTVEEVDLSVTPEKFAIKPAYPNPFNPSTTIEYALPKDGKVSVTIYDLTGQRVSSLVNAEKSAGWHKIRWNGTDNNGIQMPAGIYLVTVNTGNSIKTMKLIFVK